MKHLSRALMSFLRRESWHSRQAYSRHQTHRLKYFTARSAQASVRKTHMSPIAEKFRRFAHRVSFLAGSPWAFVLAVLAIVIWACLGPAFQFSDTWQLVINTGTTIVTFLMVFLIQNTQNRDSRALHLKLDELIRANSHARNRLIDLEELSDIELDKIHDELCHWNRETEKRIAQVRNVRKSKRSY